jgi:hypothetical protein
MDRFWGCEVKQKSNLSGLSTIFEALLQPMIFSKPSFQAIFLSEIRLKTLLLLCFGLFVQQNLQAQYVQEDSSKTRKETPSENRPRGFDKTKLVPGGNLAMSFGNPYFVDLSPYLGYLVSEKMMLGLGATYLAYGVTINGTRYTRDWYGGRLLGRYRIDDSFFLNAELEQLNAPNNTNFSNQEDRKWVFSPYVGASYVLPFGRRGGVQATLLYNLNYQENYSPWNNALVWRIGFFL